MPPRLRLQCLTAKPATSTSKLLISNYPTISSSPLLSLLRPSTATAHSSTRNITTTQQFSATKTPPTNIKRRRDPATGGFIKAKKTKKTRTHYRTYDKRNAELYSLTDAMRYFRAAEVGRDPITTKYEVAIKLKTPVGGSTVKNTIRLPHVVKTDMRICVFAEGAHATAAKNAGAYLVGSKELWAELKEGTRKIDFTRCIAHRNVVKDMQKSQIGRILGPHGLMPNERFGTILDDVAGGVRLMIGTEIYKERVGVVRLAIGQLAFTKEQLSANIKAFVDKLRSDLSHLDEAKSVDEVVLSTTRGPGIYLNGEVESRVKANTGRESSPSDASREATVKKAGMKPRRRVAQFENQRTLNVARLVTSKKASQVPTRNTAAPTTAKAVS